jgi:hypothetical protein
MSKKNPSLTHFVECLSEVPNPRSKQGVSHPFATILAITFLGLIANVRTPAEIARWAMGNGRHQTATDLAIEFSCFCCRLPSAICCLLLMLNVFAHKLKLHLASWDCKGDKTNETGCLKLHAEELFTMYPGLQLLTGDAAYANRPLVEVIRKYDRDYLFQVKNNMPKAFAKLEEAFQDAPSQESDDCVEIVVDDTQPQKSSQRKTKSYDCKVSKKRGLLRSANYG